MEEKRYKVRETAFALGISTFVIYSMFKGEIEGGLTEDQLRQVYEHINQKGFKPYRYNPEEVMRVKLWVNSQEGAQQHITEA